MEKMKMHTPNFTDENIAKIAELFPNCVTEVEDDSTNAPESNNLRESAKSVDKKLKQAIDFDLLKQELSHHIVEGPKERYHLNWPGKKEALLTANAPIAKTLRPCRKESVEFDTTENLFIEGDNLDALKLLQESYLGKVKMIYIDPPYNTGKDFIYADNFAESTEEYLLESGQKDEEGNRLVANTDANGRFHSDWLSMMYSRLKLAKNLLKDDGVIVIHIDENEYPNLEKLLTEIFGAENNLGTVVWDKRNPKGDATGIAQQHELICFYCKNRGAFKEKVDFRRPKENAKAMLNKVAQLISSEGGLADNVRSNYKAWLKKQSFSGGDKAYSLIDADTDIYRPVSMAWPNKKKAPDSYFVPLIHPVTKKECPVPERGWRNPPETMAKLQKSELILFGADETTQPNRKYLLKENMYENVSSLIYYGGSDDTLLSELGVWFDTPKVVNVSKRLLQSVTQGNDIILDFFAGSATTAHAVMQLNAEDGGNRKFIMVQLPEECDEKSEAFKAGYSTIAEISKERIRRAGQKIKDELTTKNTKKEEAENLFRDVRDFRGSKNATSSGEELTTKDTKNTKEDELFSSDSSASSASSVVENKLDTGFRVLKVASGNLNEVYYNPDALNQSDLFDHTDNIKTDRTAEDLLFHILLDWGLPLDLPFEKKILTTKNTNEPEREFEVLFVDGNAMAVCLVKNGEIDEAFCKVLAAEKPLRAVFRDAGFKDDSAKINAEQIFKLLTPDTELKTI